MTMLCFGDDMELTVVKVKLSVFYVPRKEIAEDH